MDEELEHLIKRSKSEWKCRLKMSLECIEENPSHDENWKANLECIEAFAAIAKYQKHSAAPVR